MRIIDISVPISSASVVWPGAPKTELNFRRSMEKGDKSNNSNLFMNCHAGTHVDAPFHFVKEGLGADQLPLEAMIGEAFIFDFSTQKEMTVEGFERSWPREGARRILIKTANSRLWRENSDHFVKDYVALTEATTRWLLKRGIELVGIDYLSIQRFGDAPIVHQLLLKAGVVILEGLDLSGASSGFYELLCLPLKLVGADGAPARVVLRKNC